MQSSEIAAFLTELSEVQHRTLSLLQRKGEYLGKSDIEGLARIAEEEREAINDLQKCLDWRERLLEIAKSEGLPSDSIESLGSRLSKEEPDAAGSLPDRIRESTHQTRLLRHQGLTNWVMTQRTLIHLSQILEIIATKGRTHSTYKRDRSKESGANSGALVDRSA